MNLVQFILNNVRDSKHLKSLTKLNWYLPKDTYFWTNTIQIHKINFPIILNIAKNRSLSCAAIFHICASHSLSSDDQEATSPRIILWGCTACQIQLPLQHVFIV